MSVNLIPNRIHYLLSSVQNVITPSSANAKCHLQTSEIYFFHTNNQTDRQ